MRSKQEQCYVDVIGLVAEIAKEGFGIDIIHNPLFSGVFQQQIERHHGKLVTFINKYVPVETPMSSPPPVHMGVPQVQYQVPPGYQLVPVQPQVVPTPAYIPPMEPIQPQPVIQDTQAPVVNYGQSEQGSSVLSQ